MIASSIIMGRALAPVQMGIGSWKSMVEARGAWHRLDELFKERSEEEKMDLPEPTGQIATEGVTLRMGDNFILRDIGFSLQAGESMGLIGPSGAGKTTLCRLLLGIWPPTAGHVRLDGADISNWDPEKLGPYLGYLPQEVELFAVSIAENIARLGEVDSEKVIAAARMAGVHELVLQMPQGYDTRVGEGGVVLSGGQRKRIGLARALYDNPKLVVLDEPDSNLDDEGEKALLESWKNLKEAGTTLIVVSHKPSLLASVDKVLVLKEGQAAMFGDRDQIFKTLMQQRQAGSPAAAVQTA